MSKSKEKKQKKHHFPDRIYVQMMAKEGWITASRELEDMDSDMTAVYKLEVVGKTQRKIEFKED